MFGWMSSKGKDAWELLLWFFLFTYVPVVPAYYIMSLRGLLGLFALVYAAFSWYMIYLLYTRFEKNNNMIKPIGNQA